MTRSALKWEYDYKRSEEERESLESSMEKLRSEMDKTEAKKKALNEKVFRANFGAIFNKYQGSHRLEKYLNLEHFLEKFLKIKYL